jgi:anthranilate phosphoribosyltransferase
MSDGSFARLLKRVADGEQLSSEDAAIAFGAIMDGGVGDVSIAAFVSALAVRRPTVDEIVGAALAMRAKMSSVESVKGAIDLCGTGGDGRGTLNVSTACTFVVAGAGVPVAKHGNRNMSSRSGAADVIEALGAQIDLDPARSTACLKTTGVCFLFAQVHHPGMKSVAAVRRALGFRTIFNLLGPLANPARVARQLVGVFAEEWLEPLAEALLRLGTERAWVVHGEDGLDEISIGAATSVAVLEDGRIRRRRIEPDEVGIVRAGIAEIAGGTAAENAQAIRHLLEGRRSAFRDIVLINSAAALCVAGVANDLQRGVALAEASIESGRARAVLEAFVAQTCISR